MNKGWEANEQSGAKIEWDSWNPRMERIYGLVAGELTDGRIRSVMDLGAGQMHLKSLLPKNVQYEPVDYVRRSSDTVVCDFNRYEFPDHPADLVVAAGVLAFLSDAEWFLKKAYACTGKKFILTFSTLDQERNLDKRKNFYFWKNHYSFSELYQLLVNSGFLPVYVEKGFYELPVEQVIFVLKRRAAENLPELVSCVGCGACAEVCPAGALRMEYDEEGFMRSVFQAEKCTHCQACLAHCPALHTETANEKDPESYAVWAADEIRRQSSSGGAFTLLAEETLKNGGAVCGARFCAEDQSVRHVIARNMTELAPLRGSKYVQSDMRDMFREIRRQLETDMTSVLFGGCPCQVVALKTYLGREFAQLYTVDFLCGGVVAPENFRRYLEENYNAGAIRDVQFRTKKFGWSPFYITVSFKDGTEVALHRDQDPYEKLFHSFAGMRQSCYACPFAAFPRQGDLTIGDFWGVQNCDPHLDDQKGTSFVCVNNEKGGRLFAAARGNAVMIRTVPWQYTAANRVSPFLAERSRMPETRDYFYHLLQTHSFREAVERSVGMQYDVGVVCNWSGDNYGAQLTQYAFYHTLVGMGLEPLMIERPRMPYAGGNASVARLFRENPYPSYALCRLFDNLDEMREINRYADTFIVPSDQLWNALFAEKDLFALGYVAGNKKKISYATSFGCDPHNWEPDELARETFFLRQFDAVSVREDSAVRILRESLGIDGAVQTLDPVFLCGADFYQALCAKSAFVPDGKYLAAFILDPGMEKAEWVRKFCAEQGWSSVQVCDANSPEQKAAQWDLPVERDVRIEDLLAIIRDSEFVLTDSFHGVCFSVLFEKPFLAIGNRKRGLARFESLFRLLHLEERLVEDLSGAELSLPRAPIDYRKVKSILDVEKEKSVQWLRQALAKPKQEPMTAYDILDEKITQESRILRETGTRNQAAFDSLEGRIGGIDAELLRINRNADAVNVELLRMNHHADAANAELLRMSGYVDELNSGMLRIGRCADEAGAELLRVNQRADAVNAELLRVNQRTDAVSAELLRANQRADTVSAELLRANQRTDAVNDELLRINQHLDEIGAELLRMNGCTDAVNKELLRVNGCIDEINAELLRMNHNADEVYAEQINVREWQSETLAAHDGIRGEQEKQWKQMQIYSRELEQLTARVSQMEKSFFRRIGRAIKRIPYKIYVLIKRFF